VGISLLRAAANALAPRIAEDPAFVDGSSARHLGELSLMQEIY
jgi:hypothetical protein